MSGGGPSAMCQFGGYGWYASRGGGALEALERTLDLEEVTGWEILGRFERSTAHGFGVDCPVLGSKTVGELGKVGATVVGRLKSGNTWYGLCEGCASFVCVLIALGARGGALCMCAAANCSPLPAVLW